jgi:hypothetical protein
MTRPLAQRWSSAGPGRFPENLEGRAPRAIARAMAHLDVDPSERSLVTARATTEAADSSLAERRDSGKRARARDRLMDRATRPYPKNESLRRVENVENLLLFIDDDLRETALAMERVEGYLIRTLDLLERKDLARRDVQALANDTTVLEHVDMLNETLESLRRRMARLASTLR